MTKGWHNERYRHSLASRGIRTSTSRKWRRGHNPTEMETKVYDMGKQTARDAFYLGGQRQNFYDDMEYLIDEVGIPEDRVRGYMYLASVRGAWDFLEETYLDQMTDEFGKRNRGWAHPNNYAAFVRGYRQEMEDLYRNYGYKDLWENGKEMSFMNVQDMGETTDTFDMGIND